MSDLGGSQEPLEESHWADDLNSWQCIQVDPHLLTHSDRARVVVSDSSDTLATAFTFFVWHAACDYMVQDYARLGGALCCMTASWMGCMTFQYDCDISMCHIVCAVWLHCNTNRVLMFSWWCMTVQCDCAVWLQGIMVPYDCRMTKQCVTVCFDDDVLQYSVTLLCDCTV